MSLQRKKEERRTHPHVDEQVLCPGSGVGTRDDSTVAQGLIKHIMNMFILDASTSHLGAAWNVVLGRTHDEAE